MSITQPNDDIGTQGCIGIRSEQGQKYCWDFQYVAQDWLRGVCDLYGDHVPDIPLFVKQGYQTSQSELNDYVSYQRP